MCYQSAWPGPSGSAPGSRSCPPRPCPTGPGGRRRILTAQVVFQHSICLSECSAVTAAASPTAAWSRSPTPLHHLPAPATSRSGRHDFDSATSRFSAPNSRRAVPRLLPPPPQGIMGLVVRARHRATPRAWGVMAAVRSRLCGAKKSLPCTCGAGSTLASLEMGLFPFFFTMFLKDGMKIVFTSRALEE